GAATVQASDDMCCDMPNPFDPVPIHTESRGAKWRHPFHDMRMTIVNHFKVIPGDLDNSDPTTFEKLKADPAFYVDRKVQFEIYYAKPGSFYRPFLALSQEQYVNFSAWGYGTELWTKEGRLSIHPLFYIDKRRKELIEKMQSLPMYTPVRVWAEVKSKSDNSPWFEVLAAEVIPEVVLSTSTLRHIELGAMQIAKTRYDLAIPALEGALKLQIPLNAETKVYSMLSKAYFEQRNFACARSALVNAILRDKNNVENLVLLARTDLRIERAEEAKQAAMHAISLEPSNASAHAELGLALAMLDDIRGGYKELDIAQRLARNQLPEANRNRAMIALREGKLAIASEELKQAVILRPRDVELKLELGDVHLAMNDIESARLEYSQARDLAMSLTTVRPEPFYKLAVLLKKQGDMAKKDGKEDAAKKFYEEALENAKQAILRDDTFTPAYGLQAELLRALGRTEEAQKVLENGARIRRHDPLMQEYIYQQAVVLGDWAVMEQTTRTLLEKKQTAELYSRLGNVLSSKPEPDMAGAAMAYENAVAKSPNRAQDWMSLGHARLALNDSAGAEQALLQAVKLDSKNVVAWSDLALAQRDLGKVDDAVRSAEQAAAIEPTVASRLIVALTKIERGAPGDAEAAGELAQQLITQTTDEKDKAHATAILAASKAQTGQLDEALNLFSAASSLAGESASYNLWYGTALSKAGVYSGAEEHLRSAMGMAQSGLKSSRAAQRIFDQASKELKTAQSLARNKGSEKPVVVEKKPEPKIEEPKKKTTEVQPPVEPATGASARKTAPVIEEPPNK
ncbi:MAG TPA: tetratricopeptide repeat protein, partial [Planctomycetota bacterium]|nr:tetratricopeptide repeat protein [Planctomycetota bacterium]